MLAPLPESSFAKDRRHTACTLTTTTQRNSERKNRKKTLGGAEQAFLGAVHPHLTEKCGTPMLEQHHIVEPPQ
jgi:hypothetical protein